MIKLKPGMAVHCDTLVKSKIFLNECSKQGIVCSSGEDARELNVWNQLKHETTYGIYNYAYKDNTYKLEFGSKEYYTKKGFKVLEFDDLFKEEKVNEVIFNKPSFIHSDVEKVIRNGNCVVVILDTGEKGIAKLHPDDKFDLKAGYEISYQRATIERLKNEIKNEEYILNIKKGKIIETHNELLEQFVNNSMNILGNMKQRI